MSEKRALIESGAEHKAPSVRQQCNLLGLNRSSWYAPRSTAEQSPGNVVLMQRIDALYTAHPFYGSRKLGAVLRREGHTVNRKRIQRLMRLMGLQSVAPQQAIKNLGTAFQHFSGE